jgi:hypothetical protein
MEDHLDECIQLNQLKVSGELGEFGELRELRELGELLEARWQYLLSRRRPAASLVNFFQTEKCSKFFFE